MLVVGIDVGKAELFVCLRSASGNQASRFANTAAGHRKLLTWLKKSGTDPSGTQAVMESTSVYWELLAVTLFESGFKVSVVNPAKIKFFARSLLRRGKTDTLDADLIAQYGSTMRPACWTPPPNELLELRALVRDREVIVNLITLEKGRRHAMEHQAHQNSTTKKWSDARLALLEKQLEAANQAIEQTVRKSALLKPQVKLLNTVPGIGTLTASILLCETMNLGELEHADQWSTYAGLSPTPRQSGNYKGKTRISKIGNPRLRRAFFLSALTCSRLHNPFGAFFRHLVAEGKPKKVALIALARKIIRLCFAVLKSGRRYEASYQRAMPCPA